MILERYAVLQSRTSSTASTETQHHFEELKSRHGWSSRAGLNRSKTDHYSSALQGSSYRASEQLGASFQGPASEFSHPPRQLQEPPKNSGRFSQSTSSSSLEEKCPPWSSIFFWVRLSSHGLITAHIALNAVGALTMNIFPKHSG